VFRKSGPFIAIRAPLANLRNQNDTRIKMEVVSSIRNSPEAPDQTEIRNRRTINPPPRIDPIFMSGLHMAGPVFVRGQGKKAPGGRDNAFGGLVMAAPLRHCLIHDSRPRPWGVLPLHLGAGVSHLPGDQTAVTGILSGEAQAHERHREPRRHIKAFRCRGLLGRFT